MADKILKLQPVPTGTSKQEVKNVLKDFRVSEVSLRGDAAYVKFQEFGKDEEEVLWFTFQNNKLQRDDWDTTLTVLPVTDWDSSEEEVIEAPGINNAGEHEKLARSEIVYDNKDFEETKAQVEQIKSSIQEIKHDLDEVKFIPEKIELAVEEPRYTREETEQVTLPKDLPYVKPQQPELGVSQTFGKDSKVSLAKPVGVKEQVQKIISEVKEEVKGQLKQHLGQLIPQWTWPVALALTMLSFSFH